MTRVRISLGIDSDGRWVASGWSLRPGTKRTPPPACMGQRIVSGVMGGGFREYVVEMDIPLAGTAAAPLNVAVIDVSTGEILES